MKVWVSTYGKILLVGEDQENSVSELVLIQHALQLLPGLDDTVSVIAVNDEDDTLGVLEVMTPQRTDLVLSTNIPHGELDVLVLDRLDVETCAPSRQYGGVTRLGAGGPATEPRPKRGEKCIPMVGMVVTISPSLSLYRMVVFPAASRPTIKILISFFPHSLSNNLENVRPMMTIGIQDATD
jgi:hypothetical protein